MSGITSCFQDASLSETVGLKVIGATFRLVEDARLKLLDDSSTPSQFLQELVKLKKSLADEMHVEGYLTSLLAVWKHMSSFECKEELGFHLPLIYVSSSLKSVLKRILAPVLSMRKYFVSTDGSQAVGTGSSTLLSGPLGVGKSTIFECLYVLLSLCMEHVVPVYYEYPRNLKDLCTPKVCIQQALRLRRIEPTSPADGDFDGFLSGIPEKMVVFFGDDVQNLYAAVDHPFRTNAEIGVSQIASIGKHRFHIGVVCGSSRNTEAWVLYPEKTARLHNFVTLNNTVYASVKLEPLRTEADMAEFCQLHGKNVSAAFLRSLFAVTGGVPRKLISSISLLNSDPVMAKVVEELVDLPAAYPADGAVVEILQEMLMLVKGSIEKEEFDPWKNSHSLSLTRVLDIIEAQHPEGDRLGKFAQYCDESILVETSRGRVEMLVPGQLVRMFQQLPVSSDRLEAIWFEATLTGWAETSSDVVPSTGHRNDDVVRRMIAKRDDVLGPSNSYRYDPTAQIFGTGATKPKLRDITDQLLQGVTNCKGIDGFLFTYAEKGKYDLTVIQIKTDHVNKEILAGTSAQANTALGIVAKAISGTKLLLSMISADASDSIRVKQFILATTKIVKAETVDVFQKAVAAWDKHSHVEFVLLGPDDVFKDLDPSMAQRLSKWSRTSKQHNK
jgi:hypothetical protein